jgi:peptidoglycan hydrolase-like protein with peptidoglycan-binding domain
LKSDSQTTLAGVTSEAVHWQAVGTHQGVTMIAEIVGIDTSSPMLLSTEGSVGQGGRNEPSDVRLIQTLLNRIPANLGGPPTPLVVDALVGPKSVAAIRRFQTVTFGTADGLVDARNRTIRQLILTAMARNPSPAPPRLGAADRSETGALISLFSRNSPFAKSVSFAQNSSTLEATNALVGSKSKLLIIGAFKAISPKGALPFSADFSLPSFTSTKGTILRGLMGAFPLFSSSFFGVCQFGSVGISGPVGAAINFFQFGFAPGVPGLCVGFAFVAGEQKGVPGVSAGGGTGVCVPA